MKSALIVLAIAAFAVLACDAAPKHKSAHRFAFKKRNFDSTVEDDFSLCITGCAKCTSNSHGEIELESLALNCANGCLESSSSDIEEFFTMLREKESTFNKDFAKCFVSHMIYAEHTK